MKTRLGIALALLLLAAFAGLYLSGYVTILLLKLNIPLACGFPRRLLFIGIQRFLVNF
ncbi:hypothetical protein [Xanthomonas sp. MUS 060]|uniref:hypothetical protein n=1 Tax=Xanthomonas sp. MUS 060 TaxID=1588031 RepID=UPI00137914F0|nr:hypothetical protein [Xanthomonas sp. MUS 060]